MSCKILIYKNNKFYKKESLKKINNENYIYKWSGIEVGQQDAKRAVAIAEMLRRVPT